MVGAAAAKKGEIREKDHCAYWRERVGTRRRRRRRSPSLSPPQLHQYMQVSTTDYQFPQMRAEAPLFFILHPSRPHRLAQYHRRRTHTHTHIHIRLMMRLSRECWIQCVCTVSQTVPRIHELWMYGRPAGSRITFDGGNSQLREFFESFRTIAALYALHHLFWLAEPKLKKKKKRGLGNRAMR